MLKSGYICYVMQEDANVGLNGTIAREVLEISTMLTSLQTEEAIIKYTAWYIIGRYNVPFVTVIVSKQTGNGSVEVFHYIGYERGTLSFVIKDISQITDFFSNVEFNATDITFFEKNYPDASLAGKLKQLGTDVIVPLKTQNGVLGIVLLPCIHSQAEQVELVNESNQIFYLTNLLGFTSVALENLTLHRRTTIDTLTGLYSRYYFEKALENEMSRAVRYRTSFSLIMLDIDHFKNVNDTYGHPQGDIILKELAELINLSIRHADFAARYGGEEFTIILPETDLYESGYVAERLRIKVDEYPFTINASQLHITVSLGVSEFSAEPCSAPLDLIDRADKALYESKKMGRNRVTLDTTKSAP